MPQAHGSVKTSGHSAEVIKTTNRTLGCKKLPNRKYHWKYYNFCSVSQGQITDSKAKHVFKNAIHILMCLCVCAHVCK